MENKENTYKEPVKGTDEELWFAASAADDTHRFDAEAAYERFRRRTGIEEPSMRRQLWRCWLSCLLPLIIRAESKWRAALRILWSKRP